MSSAVPTPVVLEQKLRDHGAFLGDARTVTWLRIAGLHHILRWLQEAPGDTWQERWDAHHQHADAWKMFVEQFPPQRRGKDSRGALCNALTSLFCLRLLRPTYGWFIANPKLQLINALRRGPEKDDLERFLHVAKAHGMGHSSAESALAKLVRIMLCTGKRMPELQVQDFYDYRAFLTTFPRNPTTALGVYAAQNILHALGILSEPAPDLHVRPGRRSVDELVTSCGIKNKQIQCIFIRYFQERELHLDYHSLVNAVKSLCNLYWVDLERHHPGITSLHLPRGTAQEWKKRVRLNADGTKRINVHSVFHTVRAFYLDLAQWASEHPEEWGALVFPPPVTSADLREFRHFKHKRRQKMQDRTRQLVPLMPQLLRSVREHWTLRQQLLSHAQECVAGEIFETAGRTWQRVTRYSDRRNIQFGLDIIWVREVGVTPGTPFNCQQEEEDAFWTWAILEVGRHTGLRREEILELTRRGIDTFTTSDGQQVLTLTIAPSKTDQERWLPIAPDLAHVLATIIRRVQGNLAKFPVVERYDPNEKVMGEPLTYLFQRTRSTRRWVLSDEALPHLLRKASRRAGLKFADGEPATITSHDLRRMYATEAVHHGLPLHILAKLMGHADLETTRGYAALYDEDVLRQHRAYLARRRALRPPEEYREPTDEEWAAFETHFRRRKMALGDCFRPYQTPCPHEHACVRCPALKMDPEQLPRLIQIEHDTQFKLLEAREHGWAGEVVELETTLQGILEKKIQIQPTHIINTE